MIIILEKTDVLYCKIVFTFASYNTIINLYAEYLDAIFWIFTTCSYLIGSVNIMNVTISFVIPAIALDYLQL